MLHKKNHGHDRRSIVKREGRNKNDNPDKGCLFEYGVIGQPHMYGHIYVYVYTKYVRTHGRTGGRADGQTDGCMYVCMYVCTQLYACMKCT